MVSGASKFASRGGCNSRSSLNGPKETAWCLAAFGFPRVPLVSFLHQELQGLVVLSLDGTVDRVPWYGHRVSIGHLS